MNQSVKYIKKIFIDQDIIDELRKLCFSENGTRRICLHDAPNSLLHTMVIEIQAGRVFPPHRHIDSDEILFILDGHVKILIWEKGIDQTPLVREMKGGGVIGCMMKIPRNIVHMTQPVTQSIYTEVKMGPFVASNLERFSMDQVFF